MAAVSVTTTRRPRGLTKVLSVRQWLRGEAHPAVQVKNCDLALAHGTGGSLGTRHAAATVIMEGVRASLTNSARSPRLRSTRRRSISGIDGARQITDKKMHAAARCISTAQPCPFCFSDKPDA